MKRRTEDICCRCGLPVDLKMSPMLKHEVWKIVHPDGDWDDDGNEWSGDLMCLACMEKALGRKVLESDLILMDEESGHAHHVWWNEKFIREKLDVGRLAYPLDSDYLKQLGFPERS